MGSRGTFDALAQKLSLLSDNKWQRAWILSAVRAMILLSGAPCDSLH
jgi:hypothetical protein